MKTGARFLGWIFSGLVGYAVGYSAGRNPLEVARALPLGREPRSAVPSAHASSEAGPEGFAGDRAPRKDAQGTQTAGRMVTRQGVGLVGDAPRMGATEPWVVLVVFSNYDCPSCARLGPVIDGLLAEYPDSVAVEYRQLPLPGSPRALAAARAALAANALGKFHAYHEALLHAQGSLFDDELRRIAKQIGLDPVAFDEAFGQTSLDAIVRRDVADAKRLGAVGVPTTFVNGIPVRGVQTIGYMKALIDRELATGDALFRRGTPRGLVLDSLLKGELGKPVELPGPDGLRTTGLIVSPPSNAPDPGDSPRRGAKGARVELILFSDFECSHCRAFAKTLDRLALAFPEALAIVFKSYPLPMHPNAEPLAIAASAAHRQGRFWAMHDRLFALPTGVSRARLVLEAKALGLDPVRFERDLDAPEVRLSVKSDVAEGVRLGITGTPTVFINGTVFDGDKSFEGLSAQIASAMR